MSTTIYRPSRPLLSTYVPELRRQVWGRMFGRGIQSARTEAGLSVEEAARLAGIEVSEWTAIEEGHVPQELNRLRDLAAVLGSEKIGNWALLCQEAWTL